MMHDRVVRIAAQHARPLLLLVLLALLLTIGAVGEVAASHTCPGALPDPLYERCTSYH